MYVEFIFYLAQNFKCSFFGYTKVFSVDKMGDSPNARQKLHKNIIDLHNVFCLSFFCSKFLCLIIMVQIFMPGVQKNLTHTGWFTNTVQSL